MNSSDSDEDSYNERSALVPSENPAVPSYRPGPPPAPPSKQVSSQRRPRRHPSDYFHRCDPPPRWRRTEGRGHLRARVRTRKWTGMRRS